MHTYIRRAFVDLYWIGPQVTKYNGQSHCWKIWEICQNDSYPDWTLPGCQIYLHQPFLFLGSLVRFLSHLLRLKLWRKLWSRRRILEEIEMPAFNFHLDFFESFVLTLFTLYWFRIVSDLILFNPQYQDDYTWFGVSVVSYHQFVSTNLVWVKINCHDGRKEKKNANEDWQEKTNETCF